MSKDLISFPHFPTHEGFWRGIALDNFYWQTEPNQEHMAYNFDIRKVCWCLFRCHKDGMLPAFSQMLFRLLKICFVCVQRQGGCSL